MRILMCYDPNMNQQWKKLPKQLKKPWFEIITLNQLLVSPSTTFFKTLKPWGISSGSDWNGNRFKFENI